MLIPVLLTTALAAPPDRKVQLREISSNGGQVHRMEVSLAGDVLTGRTARNLSGWLYDLDGWALETFKPCDVTGVAPIDVFIGEEPGNDLWVSCADGTATLLQWDGQDLSQVSVDGETVSLQLDDSLSDIWYDPVSQLVYALSVAGTGSASIHVLDPFDEELDAFDAGVDANYPKFLTAQGYEEGVVTGGTLLVSHGGRGFSILDLGLGGAVATLPATPLQFDCDDMAPNAAGNVLCVDRALNRVFEYVRTTRSGVAVPTSKLNQPEAVCGSLDLEDPWLAVTGGQPVVWEIDRTTGLVIEPPVFQGVADGVNPINDMVSADGYLFGGGPEGGLHVVTAKPWVYPGSVVLRQDGTAVEEGRIAEIDEEYTLEFQVDSDVDWFVYVGGDRFGINGEVLAFGSTDADTEVLVTFSIDADLFGEGDNRIYIVADAADGEFGHARTSLTVDNAPGQVSLLPRNVTFGEGSLLVEFDGVADEDLDHYDVYVMTTEWDGDDWETETGGPIGEPIPDLSTPIQVDATGGEAQSIRISPLENDVTYYIGVRATDEGGKEGPMSTVVSGTPRETFTASELAGETGGSPCSTSGGPLSWLALFGALGAAALRRRRGWAALAVAGLVGAAFAPAAALAQEDYEARPVWQRRDLTPARGNVEVRYGVLNFDDPNLNDVYDQNPTNLLMVEFGPQIFRIGEIDFGVGYIREKAFTVTAPGEEGIASSDEARLTVWPLHLSLTLRAHILDEQPVVPFVRYGWDYAIWSEGADDGLGGTDVTRGGKVGTHVGAGAQLLLDIFQPRRASLLEAKTGINDTWLTFEWRRQRLDGRSAPWASSTGPGLEFDGDSITVGLKLDY